MWTWAHLALKSEPSTEHRYSNVCKFQHATIQFTFSAIFEKQIEEKSQLFDYFWYFWVNTGLEVYLCKKCQRQASK